MSRMPVASCSPSAGNFWPTLLASNRHTPARVPRSGHGFRPTDGVVGSGWPGGGCVCAVHRFADASSATNRLPLPSNAIGRFTRLKPGCVVGIPSTMSVRLLRGHQRVAVKGEAIHARRRARIQRPVVEADARAPVDRAEVLHLVGPVRRVEVKRDDPGLVGFRVDWAWTHRCRRSRAPPGDGSAPALRQPPSRETRTAASGRPADPQQQDPKPAREPRQRQRQTSSLQHLTTESNLRSQDRRILRASRACNAPEHTSLRNWKAATAGYSTHITKSTPSQWLASGQ